MEESRAGLNISLSQANQQLIGLALLHVDVISRCDKQLCLPGERWRRGWLQPIKASQCCRFQKTNHTHRYKPEGNDVLERSCWWQRWGFSFLASDVTNVNQNTQLSDESRYRMISYILNCDYLVFKDKMLTWLITILTVLRHIDSKFWYNW